MKAACSRRPLSIACASALALASLAGCRRSGAGWIEPLKTLEPGGTPSNAAIEELRKGIDRYQAEVDRKVSAAQNLGVYWKMLALKYVDNGMFVLALDALDEAVAVYPENPILFQYMGVSAARAAKGRVADAAEQARLLARAEAAYRRAIFLDPTYVNALYGLSVLLALELDRPADAEPLLATVLEREPKNLDALFLLGRIAYAGGRYEDAVDCYDRILAARPPEKLRDQAEQNMRQVKGALYEAP
ncbi:MAG: tetratricopeptide repeat protein [Spirochaetes bacterium]|nr:tetratricopeptide repeat protein [Spirochaetota bacterium]